MNKQIIPAGSIEASVLLPGSKYIANRILPMCALASSESRISNVVDNDDINTAMKGLTQLGYRFEKADNQLIIKPRQQPAQQPVSLYAAHSGTFSRFVTAIAALESQPVTIECSSKMATRPMLELFESLRSQSVVIDSPNDCLPATITGPVAGNQITIDASRSSQYLSALLIIAPLLKQGLTIEVSSNLVSRAYVDMTIQLMNKMGVSVVEDNNQFTVAATASYSGIDYVIPGDTVSATYFMGIAAISGGKVRVENFDFESVQGESGFYTVLEKMGVSVNRESDDLVLQGPAQLNAIEIDMGGMPDAVQTLAVVACFAKGTTKITNVAHLAYKESNRIEDTATELRKTGIQVETGHDYLIIHGGTPAAAEIETHEDHRMAMSMALLGIKTAGIKIRDAQVVEKSFPDYWDYLAATGVQSVSYEG